MARSLKLVTAAKAGPSIVEGVKSTSQRRPNVTERREVVCQVSCRNIPRFLKETTPFLFETIEASDAVPTFASPNPRKTGLTE